MLKLKMKKLEPLSREFLLNRGYCCNNGCTNCPYKTKIMENKYFTPAIEDLHVGYELVSNLEKQNIGIGKAPLRISKDNISHVLSNIDTYEVLYLTKEQIEADGWKLKDNVIGFNVPVFEKNNHWIMWYEKEKFLRIMPIDPSKEKFIDKMDIWMLYQGECKCINTFRTICKLLNIK